MPNITAPVADIFPNNVDPSNGNAKYKEGRTVFLYKKLTVDRDFDGQYGYGLKFREDPEGSIWNIDGEWVDSKKQPYAGAHYQAGQVVNAQLVHEEFKKKDGSQGEARKVWGISLSDASPADLAVDTASEPDAQAAPAAPFRTNNQAAATGQVLNILVALTAAGMTEEIGITEGAAYSIIKAAMIGNLEDRPLDLSTLHTLLSPVVDLADVESEMVDAAIEAGGIVISVTDVVAEETEKLEW
jgi:hypothetical protein